MIQNFEAYQEGLRDGHSAAAADIHTPIRAALHRDVVPFSKLTDYEKGLLGGIANWYDGLDWNASRYTFAEWHRS